MKGISVGLLVLLILSGCQEDVGDVKTLQQSDHVVINQDQANEAKQIVLTMKEVTDVKGVNDKENLYLSPNVKHFDRFRLKEIRKEGHDNVKKRYPDANVHLSTDRKVFMELDKLELQLKQKEISEQRFKEKLKKIEEMMKG